MLFGVARLWLLDYSTATSHSICTMPNSLSLRMQFFIRNATLWSCLTAARYGLFALCLWQTAVSAADSGAATNASAERCLPEHQGFLRARLNGSINAELSWTGDTVACTGSVRPNAEGLRLRFSMVSKTGQQNLVLLFGISGLKEGEAGRALPTNLTIMREGTGEFYGTQGDGKCTIDAISQQPLRAVPLRLRAYKITARGFCTQPARALNGEGSVLVTRFDFVGRADFESDDAPTSASSGKPTI